MRDMIFLETMSSSKIEVVLMVTVAMFITFLLLLVMGRVFFLYIRANNKYVQQQDQLEKLFVSTDRNLSGRLMSYDKEKWEIGEKDFRIGLMKHFKCFIFWIRMIVYNLYFILKRNALGPISSPKLAMEWSA